MTYLLTQKLLKKHSSFLNILHVDVSCFNDWMFRRLSGGSSQSKLEMVLMSEIKQCLVTLCI